MLSAMDFEMLRVIEIGGAKVLFGIALGLLLRAVELGFELEDGGGADSFDGAMLARHYC